MSTDPYKPKIFISYSHLDEPEVERPTEGEFRWLTFVMRFLRVSERLEEFDVFTDQLIPGGADWSSEIEDKLRTCDIFILLVSAHSMASDYVIRKEIELVRERQKTGDNVYFYPLLLTPTPRTGIDLVRDKNMRPRGMKPLSSYTAYDRDQQMVQVADEIDQIANEIVSRRTLVLLHSKDNSDQAIKPLVTFSSRTKSRFIDPSAVFYKLDNFFGYFRSREKAVFLVLLILSFSLILSYLNYQKVSSLWAKNDLPPQGSSVWEVSGPQIDGSTVYLVAEGLKRTFKFLKPSPKMSSLGALPNDLLFDGEADAVPPRRYTGNAQAFRRCGNPEPYRVEGPVRDGPVVELSGTMPVFDEGPKCQRKQDANVTFMFSFRSKRN